MQSQKNENVSFSAENIFALNNCWHCTMHSALYYSLIAPVESDGDVTLDLTSLVLSEVALDQLPTQVDELIHHMTQLMEQIHFVFLIK